MKVFLTVSLVLFAAHFGLADAPVNLLRNGSFEGALLYWHNIDPKLDTLVRGDAAVGEFSLRIAKGNVMSAPFEAKRGEPVTVSFFVKGERPGKVGVQMPPSAREVGTKAHRLWQREAEQSAEIGTDWRRVSFTWKADVPADGFWPNPNYLVQIGGFDQPIFIDGVTVTLGAEGTAAYVPRRAVEVVAECTNLPGWESPMGNAFEKGATAKMSAHVSNPGAQPQEVTVRWQLIDYEGEVAVAPPIETKVTLAPGKSFSASTSLALTRNGMVLARLAALDAKGAVLDQSDFPLTALPYPKAATKPDWRERFGGSFAGGLGVVEKFQKIGFGWIRWRPHSNGNDHLPKRPAKLDDAKTWEWHWFDKELDEQEAHGCSSHLVLYEPPHWIMEPGNSLPTDMRWALDDPRWDDFSKLTVWDKFVQTAVEHYRGRSVIYEIENEPDLGSWGKQKGAYAKFTIRTAKLIRATDMKAKIMVNNVYGIPSAENAAFFQAGGLGLIDVMSWHDYHEGWLADATAIRRMRQNMDEAGGKNVEIWFNEGWAFTNTAVDEPIACTHLTSAQSTNAIMDSVAEMSVAGQKKTVLFHTAYEEHGMSFWDYSGPGTLLWDWYNNPLPLVAAWNVLAHHIGVSEEVGFVRPPGANLCIFQDGRNGRGVVVAYADRESKADVTVELPDAVQCYPERRFAGAVPGYVVEDIMGNAAPLIGKKLVLSKTGRPALLYLAGSADGKAMHHALAGLDRKNASFVTKAAPGAAQTWSLPPAWEGGVKGESEGSVAKADGRPIWKLEQVWPPDWKKAENFRPMVWTGTDWNVKEGGFGGQPGAGLKDAALTLSTRAPHGQPPELRTAALVFVAPAAGAYELRGTAETRMWDSKNRTTLHVLRKGAGGVAVVAKLSIEAGGTVALDDVRADLAAGEELALLPLIDGMFAGGNTILRDLRVVAGAAGAGESGGRAWKLPLAWEGAAKGSAANNPIAAGGAPLWRLDQVWPDDPVFVANYVPLRWSGTAWTPEKDGSGGQPEVRVENGGIDFAVRGSWTGNEGQRLAGLCFIAPKTGIFRVSGTAKSKPWEGGAKFFKLGIFKKDAQRAQSQRTLELPRSGEAVPFDFMVELTAGHELVFLPLMPDWHNATHTMIEDLAVREVAP